MSEDLSTSSPQPLYRQLRELLRASILDGTFQPMEKLPSESELGERYGVSRITVRQALSDLRQEGLVFRISGKGTYVSVPRAAEPLVPLQGFSEAMHQAGREAQSRLLSISTLPADVRIAHALEVALESPVIEIRRVRYLDRAPISLDISFFRPELGQKLQAEDLASRDIFSLLENECGLVLDHADVSIEATAADEAWCAVLALEAGAPVLRIERLTRDMQGHPIEYEHLFYRGDAFQYRLRVERRRRESHAA